MPVIELTRDFSRTREAASIPGTYRDELTGAWMLNTDNAGESGKNLARQRFPEHADLIPSGPSAVDIRPIDLATTWFNGLDEQDIDAIYNNAIDRDLLRKLYPYQRIDLTYALARLRQDGCAYLGWEMGLGKTLGAIFLILALKAAKAVIVCPNPAKEVVWRPEIEKWAGDRDFKVFNLAGSKEKREAQLNGFRFCKGPAVLLVHYEALRLVDWSFTEKAPVDIVVCDEAHRLAKGGVSGREIPQFYKKLKTIKSKARLALSGSIIVNSPEDVFGALHWLAPQVYKSRWKDWNNRFIQYSEGPWGKIMIGLKPGTLKEMQTELATIMTVRRKDDELADLPRKLPPVYLRVDLSPAQRKVYDELAERFIAELPDGQEISAPNVISQLGKLRQIATGLDLMGDTMTDSTKIDLAAEMIEDNLPHKTVVFCWHKATVRSLSSRLGVDHVVVTGDTKMSERTASVDRFQTDPDCKVIIATIKTLGESVTLHAAKDVIFIESSWVPSDMQQAEDRLHRIGQTQRVSISHIVAKDTVDETRVLPIVKSKAEMRRLILGGK